MGSRSGGRDKTSLGLWWAKTDEARAQRTKAGARVGPVQSRASSREGARDPGAGRTLTPDRHHVDTIIGHRHKLLCSRILKAGQILLFRPIQPSRADEIAWGFLTPRAEKNCDRIHHAGLDNQSRRRNQAHNHTCAEGLSLIARQSVAARTQAVDETGHAVVICQQHNNQAQTKTNVSLTPLAPSPPTRNAAPGAR